MGVHNPRAKHPVDFALKNLHGVDLCGSVFWVVMNILGGSEELKVVTISWRWRCH